MPSIRNPVSVSVMSPWFIGLYSVPSAFIGTSDWDLVYTKSPLSLVSWKYTLNLPVFLSYDSVNPHGTLLYDFI